MAQVYVGTYRKYNNGNIDGKGLTLENYSNYEDFIKACKNIHKDERDPELMIQDTSDMPDGLDCGEWLSEEDFNDIISAIKESKEEEVTEPSKYQIIDYSEKAIAVIGDTKEIKDELKKLGGRFNPRLSCGAGWIFSKKQKDDIERLLGNGISLSVVQVNKAQSKYKDILNEYISAQKLPSDAKYLKENNIGAINVNGKYMLIEKPTIENSFWFGDEGEDLEYYKEVTKDDNSKKKYFIASNLSKHRRQIERLSDKNNTIYFSKGYSSKEDKLFWYAPTYTWQDKQFEADIEATQEQREDLINAITWSMNEFQKRLESYLKRYGTSKLRFGTYWRDR